MMTMMMLRRSTWLAVIPLALAASPAACARPASNVQQDSSTHAAPSASAIPPAQMPSAAPAPSAPVAQAPAAKAPAVSAGDIGTAHPLVVQAVAPDGHWVAICQARADTTGDGKLEVKVGRHGDLSGDAMDSFFVRGDGQGTPIDAFAGADRSGRYVVVARGGSLVLIDTFTDRETVLPHALVDDGSSPVPARGTVSFDDAGRRLLYMRGGAGIEEIVVRDLATGEERIAQTGAGKLWRAWLDPAGQVVWAEVVVADTDGDGTVELPAPNTSLSQRRCRGPVGSASFYGWTGDKPVRRAVREADGWKGAVDAPSALGAFGRALVVRRPDRAIVRVDGADERVLVPAACDARVVYADPARERLFFGCTPDAKRGKDGLVYVPLERVEGTTRTALGLRVQLTDNDAWGHYGVLVYGADLRVLNLETGTIGTINVGPPIAIAGDHILFGRHSIGSPGGPNVLDLAAGKRTRLKIEPRAYGEQVQRGDLVAFELEGGKSALFDLAKIEVVGTFTGRPLALTRAGMVLVPAPNLQKKRAVEPLLMGPLRWVTPRRETSDTERPVRRGGIDLRVGSILLARAVARRQAVFELHRAPRAHVDAHAHRPFEQPEGHGRIVRRLRLGDVERIGRERVALRAHPLALHVGRELADLVAGEPEDAVRAPVAAGLGGGGGTECWMR